MIRTIITIVSVALLIGVGQANEQRISLPKPEFKGNEWPCPFWRYQQIGQPVMYYNLNDPNASVDDLCTAEAKLEGRE